MTADRCRIVNVDGTPARILSATDEAEAWTDDDLDALRTVIAAARRKLDDEPPAVTAARTARAARARERLRSRLDDPRPGSERT